MKMQVVKIKNYFVSIVQGFIIMLALTRTKKPGKRSVDISAASDSLTAVVTESQHDDNDGNRE
jgi:hypothetical protein